jgi:mRNA-degrading endonuclease HigB of HigAB toxin-antitoxin module
MYVVGANVLSDFWTTNPEAEGELRALHAVLSATECDELPEALGEIATFDRTGADIGLRNAKVRLEISAAGRVGRYAAIIPVEKEAR